MNPFPEELRARLDAIRANGLYRALIPPEGLDFSSNDYLGLSNDSRLRTAMERELQAGSLSAPASRLLRGNTPGHERLEARLAQFKGSEAALLFPSGYQANIGLLTALLRRDDVAVSDEQNHASIIDGLRLSGCRVETFPHLETAAVDAKLAERPERGRVFLVTESLYSMDGDVAPLDRYADLATKHGANLIVDDAHATGLYGERRGSGLVEHYGVERRITAAVSTCGKALGLCGAFVTGSAVLIDYLVNRARPFIFSTAQPPVLLAAIHAALDIVESEPGRRDRVLMLAARLRRRLVNGGVDCLRSTGPIVPVILGDSGLAVRVARGVRSRGFDVRAVRPPAVRPRTARLRVSVHADHTEEQIDHLAEAILGELGRKEATP